jgi:hypothetical protein
MVWNSQCSECQKNARGRVATGTGTGGVGEGGEEDGEAPGGEVCSFPLATNPSNSGKHWKILDLAEVERELEIIQGMQPGGGGT